MQVTKGTWRMRGQCVPGSFFSAHAQEPGNEANVQQVTFEPLGCPKPLASDHVLQDPLDCGSTT